MSSRAERAAARRERWQGGRARSFEQATEQAARLWRQATPAQRLEGVFQLIGDAAVMKGDEPQRRLSRSACGVRSRGYSVK